MLSYPSLPCHPSASALFADVLNTRVSTAAPSPHRPRLRGDGDHHQRGKKVCIPKIDLQFWASLINFIFFPRKNIQCGWAGSGGGTQAAIPPPLPPPLVTVSLHDVWLTATGASACGPRVALPYHCCSCESCPPRPEALPPVPDPPPSSVSQVLHALQFSNASDPHLKSLQTCQQVSGVVPQQEQHRHERLKEKAKTMYLPDRGGSYQLWDRRPLHPTLRDYAAADVKFMLAIKRCWESSEIDGLVMDIAQDRIKQTVLRQHPPRGSDMAKRDFPLYDKPPPQVRGASVPQGRQGAAREIGGLRPLLAAAIFPPAAVRAALGLTSRFGVI